MASESVVRSPLAENRISPGIRLFRWQKVVKNWILDQDERTILFVVDPTGSRGKTFLAQHMFSVCAPGTHVNITLDRPRHFSMTGDPKVETVIFDYGRGVRPIAYAWYLIRNLKDGINPNDIARYQKPVKVAVFSHYEPTTAEFDLLKGSGNKLVVLFNLDQVFAHHGISMFDQMDI